MITGAQAETAMNASKIVMCLDHIKNNRIEYLILVAIGHMIGATSFVVDKAAGVCA